MKITKNKKKRTKTGQRKNFDAYTGGQKSNFTTANKIDFMQNFTHLNVDHQRNTKYQ